MLSGYDELAVAANEARIAAGDFAARYPSSTLPGTIEMEVRQLISEIEVAPAGKLDPLDRNAMIELAQSFRDLAGSLESIEVPAEWDDLPIEQETALLEPLRFQIRRVLEVTRQPD